MTSSDSDSTELVTGAVTTSKKPTTQPQNKRPRSVAPTSHQATSGSGDSDLQIVRTPSPAPALPKNHLKDVYTSPDRLRLREALLSGGEMGFKAVQKCKVFVILVDVSS